MQRIISKVASMACVLLVTACGGGGGSSIAPPTPAPAPPTPPPTTTAPDVEVERLFPALSFSLPVALKQAPADDSRWYVVEKQGTVLAFDNDNAAATTDVFLDISSRVNSTLSETGLLGLAFHPQFPATPEVFVSYNGTGTPLTSVVSRFTLDNTGTALDPGSEEVLLLFEQPQSNHNGGDLAFGPNGLLYASFGDGGGGGDPDENGQDTTTIYGSVIRIDIDAPAPYGIPPDNPFASGGSCRQGFASANCAEIFAWGFRNPWRMSFDSATATLWLGDVGQGAWEEINRVTLGGNYGWNDREGAHCFDPATNCMLGFDEPVTEYDHSVGQSVTGGYVYRGTGVTDLSGFYVFGDFVSGQLFAVDADAQPTTAPDLIGNAGFNISAFAVDTNQELFVLDFGGGGVYRIVGAP